MMTNIKINLERFLYDEGILKLNVSRNIINDLTNTFIVEHNIQGQVRKIDLHANCGNNYGYYKPYSKEIGTNIDILVAKTLKDYSSSDYKVLKDRLYYFVAYVLYHELAHAKQQRDLDNEKLNPLLANLLHDSFSIAYCNSKDYRFNHGIYPQEHHATAYSAPYLVEFLRKNNFDNDINTNEIIINALLANYYIDKGHLVSPCDKFYILNHNIFEHKLNTERFSVFDYNRENVFNKININIYEKMLYGLPIDMDVYKELLSLKEEKSIDVLEKIKKYR